ncbi:MAG: inorganic diphosphatase [Ferrovibrio sp.]
MNFSQLPPGRNPPDDINVVVEIPMGGEPVKYEFDKALGLLVVDRFIHTAMRYPANYGFIPNTLADDDDPVDVLVISPSPVMPGAMIRSRPIGILQMRDESGDDEKIIAVPLSQLHPYHDEIKNIGDLPAILRDQIAHFFEHYKDLEKGKWTQISQWADADFARTQIVRAIDRFGVVEGRLLD